MTEDRPTAIVWLKGDRSVVVGKPTLEQLLLLPATLIPAQPNTYLLALATGDSSELDVIRRTAVVAWATTMDGVLRPVTVDGVAEVDDLTVETSDGFVTARGARRWLSVEAWLRDQLNPAAAA
ncbi:MAG: hypothetical protein ACXU82_17325 [Caulobacteraceae bacterium]